MSLFVIFNMMSLSRSSRLSIEFIGLLRIEITTLRNLDKFPSLRVTRLFYLPYLFFYYFVEKFSNLEHINGGGIFNLEANVFY